MSEGWGEKSGGGAVGEGEGECVWLVVCPQSQCLLSEDNACVCVCLFLSVHP